MTILVRHEHYVYLKEVVDLRDQLTRIELGIEGLNRKGTAMSKELDDLKAEVERNTTVDASALALIQGLAAKLDAAADNPRAIRALADQLRAQNDDFAAALTANTPADTGTGTTGTGTTGTGDTGTGGEEVLDTGTSGPQGDTSGTPAP